MVIGALMLIAILLGVLAAHIYGNNPPPQNPGQQQVIDQRLAPVGAVFAGDTGRAAMLAAQEAAKKAAASQVAYGGTLDGKTIFGNLCQTCHTTGAAGAPKITDKTAWGPRVAEGLETLIQHAIDGYTGPDGNVMPPRGGNPALTDAQVKATVQWMVDQVK
ncbi:MAG TPA: c-type cytochrome [Rhodanobacteraceae bacterium]|nr:c-type cytochrome [Rhodanobacteraceae bacterium]